MRYNARIMTGEIYRPPIDTVDIIYGGGTITSVVNLEGAREGDHSFHLTPILEERDPETTDLVGLVGNQAVPFTGLSENMTTEVQTLIGDAVEAALTAGTTGVLVTHGTDSMEQTARYLHGRFTERAAQEGLRIVMTGANEDMEHPQTDVFENFRYSLEQAADTHTPAGVYVAYHGKLIPANQVVKLPYLPGKRPTFVSVQSSEYSKASAEQQAIINRLNTELISDYGKLPDDSTAAVYDVNVITENHDNFMNYVVAHPNLKSVVLNLYHSGTANTIEGSSASVVELVQALREVRPDMAFFGVTETGEPVNLHAYVTSVQLREAGVVPLYDMFKGVAIAKLRLIDPNLPPEKRIQEMLRNRVGEIDESRIDEVDIKNLIELYTGPEPMRTAA